MEAKLVVFVLGAPGAGKGTQCELVRKELGWSHISAGDLLRAQVAAGTEVGKEAEAIMKEGKLVPSSMIIGLLKDAISSSEHTKVLIDGFPRVVDQLRDFEQQVRPCSTAFFYKVSDSTALERLNKRAESSGRVDDNADTIRKRFVVFEQDSMPVVDALRADGRLVEIDAAASPEVVYGSTKQAIQQLQEQQQLQQQAAAASSAASAALPDEDAAAIAALSASQSEAIVANSMESTLESSAAPAAPETAAAEPEAEASQLSATSTAEFRETAEQPSAQQVDGDVPALAPVTATDAAVVSAESSQHDAPAVEASKEGIQHISAAVAALDMSGPEDQSSTPVQLPAAEAAGQLSTGSEAADIPVSIAATQQEPAVDDVSSQQIDLASIRTPFVICGPSGVGKGTLINKLMTQYSDKFGFSVSHTTRAPRPGEQHGVHYNFTDIPCMKEQVAAGLFLEHAEVHGNMYGTSLAAVAQVSSRGKHCVLDIDVQGARLVKASALGPLCCFIFVAPPSHEELERRLRNRGTETEEKVLQRLANAKAEIEQGQEPGLFDHILVNADLEAAYSQLQQLINQAVPELLPTLASVPPALSAPAVQITEAPAAPGSNSTATEPAAILPVTQEAGSTPKVATANGSTTTSQHTPATAVAASTGTSTLLDFGFGASAGPAVAVKGMPVRQYMDATVIPVLREGLKALNTARPDDPLQYLADFLVAHKPATH